MKLSIIVPIYNVEKYILDCLNSIYNGDLNNFEVLCIDDCGQDNSISIVKKYKKDNNIKNLKIIKHEKNKGLSEARNTGIVNAVGEYICFLDSDDMLDVQKLKKVLDEAIKYNLDIIEANFSEISETSINISVNNKRKNINCGVMNGEDYFCYMYNNNYFVPMVWCKIYRKDYLTNNNYKFKAGLKFEDEEFTPKVLINAKKIKYINESFYIYRRRDDSITTNMVKNNNWVNHYLTIISSLQNFSKSIKNKKCYNALNNRIAEIVLNLYKNPIAYNASDHYLNEIVDIVNEKKLYILPIKSNKILIKIQGILMKHPKIFIRLYSAKGGK